MLAARDLLEELPRGAGATSEWLHHRKLERNDAYAALTVFSFCLVAALLCGILGVSFTPGLPLIGLIPGFFLLLAAGFHLVRPHERELFQILLYVGLWGALPIAGTQLTFLGSMAGFPLQTELMLKIDHSLGFSWIDWANFVLSHSYLEWLSGQAYLSYAFQPYIAVVLIALFGPRSRNANFLLATAIALGVTITISTFLPAIEPGRAYGFTTPAADAMLNARGGQRTELPYIGIICFPSFHTVMAILFVTVYRGMKFALIPACLLNAAMMFSIPFSGDHYLIDLIGGIAVALLAQYAANRLTERGARPRIRTAADRCEMPAVPEMPVEHIAQRAS